MEESIESLAYLSQPVVKIRENVWFNRVIAKVGQGSETVAGLETIGVNDAYEGY